MLFLSTACGVHELYFSTSNIHICYTGGILLYLYLFDYWMVRTQKKSHVQYIGSDFSSILFFMDYIYTYLYLDLLLALYSKF